METQLAEVKQELAKVATLVTKIDELNSMLKEFTAAHGTPATDEAFIGPLEKK